MLSISLFVGIAWAYVAASRYRSRYEQLQHRNLQLSAQLDASLIRETTLAQSEARYRALYENIPSLYLTVDEAGTILSVNSAGARQLGYESDELQGRPLQELVAPDFGPIHHPPSAFTHEVQRGEVAALHKEGNTIWMTTSLWANPNSQVAYMLWENVAALKQIELELRQSEDKFAKIFRASPIPISLTKIQDGEYLDVNDAYLRQFGWSRSEILGRSSVDVGLWQTDAERNRWRDALLDEGTLRNYETHMRTKSGEKHDVLLSAEITSIGGNDCVLALIFDITARKLAEAEVRRLNNELETRVRERTAELTAANRELESFAYSVSHDLRTPLRGIDGFSQLVIEEYGSNLDEQGRSYLRRVRKAAQRMGHLIDDLLDLSRVSLQEMRREVVNLSQLAADVIEDLQRETSTRVVRYTIQADCMARGDAELLRVLLQNLLGNAWKYTSKVAAAEVDFGLKHHHDGDTIFFVRDNGDGFDMKYIGNLFRPFHRLHRPDEFEGSGIGLASAARIVRRHGGQIWAESTVGQGATFYFTLAPSSLPTTPAT